MTPQALEKPLAALLLDIEGTTTPIDFVYNVLFPYARRRVKDYLAAHWSLPPVSSDVAGLVEENINDRTRGLDPPALEEPPDIVSIEAYVLWLMDQDRKTTPLKSLQGKIWQQGYDDGSLVAPVFEDVRPTMERWVDTGISVNIFSSGSVLAQKLLFAHTEAGDLTKFISKYFDTGVGKKTDADSYRQIASALSVAPTQVHFISDVTTELDAAADAGMKTSLCVRPGNREQEFNSRHETIQSLYEIT